MLIHPLEITKCLLMLAAERGDQKTFCPSEAARYLDAAEWRPLMPAIRVEAIRLVNAGKLRCTQHGIEVDPATARGPIRFSAPPDLPQTKRAKGPFTA